MVPFWRPLEGSRKPLQKIFLVQYIYKSHWNNPAQYKLPSPHPQHSNCLHRLLCPASCQLWGPFDDWNASHQQFFIQIQWKYPNCYHVISTKFCTRHDSIAVMACAKCGRDLPPIHWLTAMNTFYHISYFAPKIVSVMAPSNWRQYLLADLGLEWFCPLCLSKCLFGYFRLVVGLL